MLIFEIISVVEKIKLRKLMNDLNFHFSIQLYFLFRIILLITTATTFNVLIYLYINNLNINTKEIIIQFFILILITYTLFSISGFVKKHPDLFFSDNDQDIHKYEQFNFNYLKTLIFWFNAKDFLKILSFILIPLYILMINIYNLSSINLLFFTLYFFIFLNTSVLIFSFYMIKFYNTIIKFKFNILNNLILTVISLTIFFIVGYIASNLAINGQINSFIFFKKDLNIFVNFITNISLKAKIISFILILSITIITMFYYLYKWEKYFCEMGKIPFMTLQENNKIPFITKNYKYPFFKKDILHISRSESWGLKKLLLFLNIYFLIMGSAIPISSYFNNEYNTLIIISTSFLSCLTFTQFLNDALKVYLSIDAEIKNKHLFTKKVIYLNEVIYQKMAVYSIFSIIPLTFITLYSLFFFNTNLTILFFNIIGGLTIYIISGLSMLLSTALYPKYDWEHQKEIGYSKKAELFDSIYSYATYTSISILLMALYVFRNKITDLHFSLLTLSSILVLMVFILIFHLYTKKFTLLGVLTDDKN